MDDRHWWVPEVVQSSAMDCGPAALEALLRGFGISVCGARLREACQTDVDGTSIDTLEEVAVQLGLMAEQVVIPADHVLLPEADALPAIALIRLPDGTTHFVVLWRCVGPLVQVMDPAIGRRWMRREAVEAALFIHEQEVPAADWADWAGSEDFGRPLHARLRQLGVTTALPPPGPALASLDAATRVLSTLHRSGDLSRTQAQPLLQMLSERATTTPSVIPDEMWSARHLPPDADTADTVLLSGAVLVRVHGTCPPQVAHSPELTAALRAPPPPPLHALWQRCPPKTQRRLLGLGLLGAVAALATVFEAALLYLLLDHEATVGTGMPPLVIGLVVVLWVGLLLVLEMALTAGLQRAGRQLVFSLQADFLNKLPRLPDRYVATRLVSDMAERNHHLHRLQDLPEIGVDLVRCATALVVTTGALLWLSPDQWVWALLAGGSAVLSPALLHVSITEHELRSRTLAGSLGRFLLDALHGALPLRTHGGQHAQQHGQESLLVDWVRARRAERDAAVLAETISMSAGTIWAGLLVWRHLLHSPTMGGALLVAWWALRIPSLGALLSQRMRQLPPRVNAARRIFAPLGALEEPLHSDAPPRTGAVGIHVDNVDCIVGGHVLLADVSLRIQPGEHIAVVGRSGAGKSTLLGLLQGWHRPTGGGIFIDDDPLTARLLPALRQRTAWIDPTTHLWHASLLDNLTDGTTGALPEALAVSGLDPVLSGLPDGLQTMLGSTATLSDSTAQRVRIARGLGRPDAGLVLLDEPFRGLGLQERRALMARVRAYWASATLICVTHDIQQAGQFDRVLVIDDGRIVEDGAPDALANTESVFAELLAAEATLRDWWRHTPGWTRWRLDPP